VQSSGLRTLRSAPSSGQAMKKAVGCQFVANHSPSSAKKTQTASWKAAVLARKWPDVFHRNCPRIAEEALRNLCFASPQTSMRSRRLVHRGAWLAGPAPCSGDSTKPSAGIGQPVHSSAQAQPLQPRKVTNHASRPVLEIVDQGQQLNWKIRLGMRLPARAVVTGSDRHRARADQRSAPMAVSVSSRSSTPAQGWPEPESLRYLPPSGGVVAQPVQGAEAGIEGFQPSRKSVWNDSTVFGIPGV